MKVFIASPWRNRDMVQKLSEELLKRGYEVYSFLQNGANLSTGGSIGEELKMFGKALQNWENDPDIKKIFTSELEGLKGSDMVVLLQPAGHSSLLEAGIGYGMGKAVVTIGLIEQPEVFYLLCKGIYPDMDSFLADLANIAQ